jgi:hypothetical protein
MLMFGDMLANAPFEEVLGNELEPETTLEPCEAAADEIGDSSESAVGRAGVTGAARLWS